MVSISTKFQSLTRNFLHETLNINISYPLSNKGQTTLLFFSSEFDAY